MSMFTKEDRPIVVAMIACPCYSLPQVLIGGRHSSCPIKDVAAAPVRTGPLLLEAEIPGVLFSCVSTIFFLRTQEKVESPEAIGLGM